MLLEEKVERLQELLCSLPGALTAYSGGADSAFLAEMSHQTLGGQALAVTADSPSIPRKELKEAVRLAQQRVWRHKVVSTSELEDERYASNPSDRCYWCKTALFDVVIPIAEELGVPVLLGTNLDDQGEWRPGLKASQERGVIHPMVDAGLTKPDVRAASKLIGLPTHDKPAAACLASRFAYGVRVTKEGLARVETAEEWMFGRGFRIVRVRDLGNDEARVEVGPHEVPRLLQLSGEVERAMKDVGFDSITLDRQGYRSGKLNDAVLLSIGKQG